MRRLFFLFPFVIGCSGGIAPIGDGGIGADGSGIPDAGPGPDAAVPKDAGAPPPTTPIRAIYFAACLTKLAAGRTDRVLRFYTEVTYTPGGASSDGKLALKLTALKLAQPGNLPPATVSKGETVGTTYSSTSAVKPNGGFNAEFGTMTIPGTANPISGRDIVFETAALPGRFQAGKFCSQIAGDITTPTVITLTGDDNTCIYFPVNEGDPPPALAVDASDFAAGCPLD